MSRGPRARVVLPFERNSSYATGQDAWLAGLDTMTGATREVAKSDDRARLETAARIEGLEAAVLGLGDRLTWLADGAAVTIETLAPESLDLIRPFHVNVDPCEEGFRASFVDANLMAFGDTPAEAVWNLKDLLAATFETLNESGEKGLGPGPARQLAVLSQFVRRRDSQ